MAHGAAQAFGAGAPGDLWSVAMSSAPGAWIVRPEVAAPLLIAACAWSDLQLRRSMLRHRSLVVLGEWSFALYLVHVFVIKAAWLLFADAGWSRATWTAVAAVVALLSIGCAGTLYSVVERPVERYIRTRYASRRRPDHQPASASARSA